MIFPLGSRSGRNSTDPDHLSPVRLREHPSARHEIFPSYGLKKQARLNSWSFEAGPWMCLTITFRLSSGGNCRVGEGILVSNAVCHWSTPLSESFSISST